MELEINGKKRELKFNFGFIKQMDKLYKVEQNGLEMSMGVALGYNSLKLYSVTDLVKVIRASAEGSHTNTEAESAIEAYAEEHGDLEPLFKEVIEELGKSPLTKATIQNFENLGKE